MRKPVALPASIAAIVAAIETKRGVTLAPARDTRRV